MECLRGGRDRIGQVLWLLLLLWGAAGQARALGTGKPLKQYGRQSWQSDTGLPQNTVHAVAQTRDGFLWLATEGGLVRFDGQEFRTYDSSNTPALPGDSIESLVVDGAGTLWVSSAGGLVKLEGGTFARVMAAARAVRVLHDGEVLLASADGLAIVGKAGFRSLPGMSGEMFAEDTGAALWMLSQRELISMDERTGAAGERHAITDIGTPQTIAAGEHGEIWVGGRDGLALFRGGKRVLLDVHANVSTILPMGDGEAWLGTDAGLMQLAGGRVSKLSGKPATAGRVEQLYRDREGAVWVAFEEGVTRVGLDGRLQELVDLPGVLCLFEDSEGDMWFGTDAGGVTVLREQAFSTLTVQEGLSDDFVRAVFQDHTGAIWVGTNRGGLNRIADGKITTMRAMASGGLASNVVLAVAESGADLWVGTPDGLSRLHDGKFELFTTANGLPDDFVRSLYTDTDGSLWIGTRAGLSHFAKGRYASYSTLDGLGSDLIGSILRARDGTLWVGTLGGLSRFDGAGFKNFTQKEGLGGDAITALSEDGDGTIWIGAHGAGLTRLRGGVFRAICSARAGLPTEIYSVLEDRQLGETASLWMGTAKGVYRVSQAQLNAFADGRASRLGAEAFGVPDGMKISECSGGGRPAGWRMRDGSLWFATLKGVASVMPGAGLGRRPDLLPSIEQVAIDDQTVIDGAARLSGGELVVPAGRERITIHYAAPSFQAPHKVEFRYMLEGFDRDWVAAGSRRTAYYTNIPAGTYRFLVAASDREGIWSEAFGELQIKVQPRFYRTWWFYILIAVLTCGVAYSVYRLRVASVETSYQAVMAERNRIAREIHDTLAQGYVGVSLQLEIVGRMLQRSRASGAGPGQAEAQIEATKDSVKSSLEEARSSIWKLRSAQSDAEAESLPARLTAAVQAKQEGSPAVIRLTVTGTFRPLERSVEDEMLRIAQEAISNAVRHASASAIEVVLKYETRWLELKIADDGKGFVRSTKAGHYGLQGIEERAAAIGAKLRIASTPGNGTTVEATLGLENKKKFAGNKRVERG